jgi:hypothetical protein
MTDQLPDPPILIPFNWKELIDTIGYLPTDSAMRKRLSDIYVEGRAHSIKMGWAFPMPTDAGTADSVINVTVKVMDPIDARIAEYKAANGI